MKSRIYFFTGTGNSLWVAQNIAKELPDCEVVAIKNGMDMTVPAGLERVGFVFPTYGWALPLMVADFFRNAQFPKQINTYYFAVTTCGGLALNALPQTNDLLAEKGITLNYGAKIVMFKNSVFNYKMSEKADEEAAKAAKRALPVMRDIVRKRETKTRPINRFLFKLHLDFMKDIRETALDFTVSEQCSSCELCSKLCPAKNVTMENGRPVFHQRCERCGACLQHCPKQAIDYKNQTQNRGRYAHPEIKASDIAKYL